MANNKIQTKRTTVSGRTPNTTGSYATNSQYIAAGEFALNMTDGILFSSNGSSVIEIGANNRTHNISTNNLTVGSTLYVFSNGNIGVTNATPAHKLSINGNTYIGGYIKYSDGSSQNTGIHVGTSAPLSPAVGALWVDTNPAQVLKIYDSSNTQVFP